MTLRRFAMGEMTWRELRDFIENLPRNSATNRSRYGEVAEWTPTTHAVTSLYDVFTQVHIAKGQTHRPYPRPEYPEDPDDN